MVVAFAARRVKKRALEQVFYMFEFEIEFGEDA